MKQHFLKLYISILHTSVFLSLSFKDKIRDVQSTLLKYRNRIFLCISPAGNPITMALLTPVVEIVQVQIFTPLSERKVGLMIHSIKWASGRDVMSLLYIKALKSQHDTSRDYSEWSTSRGRIWHGEVIRWWSFYQPKSLSDSEEQRTPGIRTSTFVVLSPWDLGIVCYHHKA